MLVVTVNYVQNQPKESVRNVVLVEVVEGVGGGPGPSLVHQVNQRAVVGGETSS